MSDSANDMKDMINDADFKDAIKDLMKEEIRDIFSSSNKSYEFKGALFNLKTCIILNRLKMKCERKEEESNYQEYDELLDKEMPSLCESEGYIIEAFERDHMVKLPKDFYTEIDNKMIEINKQILNRSVVYIGLQRYEIIDNIDLGKALFNKLYSRCDLCIFVENKQDIIFIGSFKDYIIKRQNDYDNLQSKAWKNGKYMEWFIRCIKSIN